MIDLHVHSTHSDGSETPEELVARARRIGLKALALTDHDTMGGCRAFLDACRACDLTGIAGLELSAAAGDGCGSMHILGYGVNPEHPLVVENLRRMMEGRFCRNSRILERLKAAGIGLSEADVQACAGQEVVGRVHIAQALMARGCVESVSEAFSRYLGKGCPAYVGRDRLSPEACIGMIRAAGGIAVLAHPFTWQSDEAKLEAGVRALQAQGLAGIEAQYTDYGQEQTLALLRMALKLKLLATGGSDYHGLAKPDILLGRGFGSLCVPDRYLAPLLRALGRGHPQVVVGEHERESLAYELD